MIKTIISVDSTSSGSSTESPPELWELLGRPVLSYVLDLNDALSDETATVITGSEPSIYEESFPNRTVNWVRSDGSFADTLQQLEGEAAEEQLLFLRGNMPLVDARSLQGLIHHHEQAGASMTVLSGAESEDGFSCTLAGNEQAVSSVSEDETNDSGTMGDRRVQNASPVALVNRKQLQAVLENGDVSEDGSSDAFLFELAGRLLDEGHSVEMYLGPDESEAIQVSSGSALSEATDRLRKRVISLLMEQGVKILSPDQTYIEPDVEIGAGTVIEPFVVIRNGVKIGSNCHLGPFCQIREGTHLEDQAEIGNYVETKNSRVGRGTKAKHLSYLGDATIGEGVNIGAGTITANYDGSNKHRTVIEDYASTGSNTVLIAPVTMRENSKTGAGAVVARGNDVGEGETVVGVPATQVDRS